MAAGFSWEVAVVGPSSVDAADAPTVTKNNNAGANIAAAAAVAFHAPAVALFAA